MWAAGRRRRADAGLDGDLAALAVEEPHVPGAVELPSWDDCAAAVAELYDSVARAS